MAVRSSRGDSVIRGGAKKKVYARIKGRRHLSISEIGSADVLIEPGSPGPVMVETVRIPVY